MGGMSEEKPWPDSIRAGDCEQHEPLVRRVLAPNPSPYTFTGTQTWIVGAGSDVAVIDPGPTGSGLSIGDPADINGTGHVDAILRAIEGQRVAAILCTHTHRDHSPAAAPLKEATGAPIIGCAPLALSDDGPRADSAFDPDYAPDRVLADGERISGDGWTLEAVATPGIRRITCVSGSSKAARCSPAIMSWRGRPASSVRPTATWPPIWPASRNSMTARIASIIRRTAPAVTKPRQLVRGMLGHRKQRERQILRELEKGTRVIPEMVKHMYKGLDPRLNGAAGRSVLAHLIDLQTRGAVRVQNDEWTLA
jgi:hypothetical protein